MRFFRLIYLQLAVVFPLGRIVPRASRSAAFHRSSERFFSQGRCSSDQTGSWRIINLAILRGDREARLILMVFT